MQEGTVRIGDWISEEKERRARMRRQRSASSSSEKAEPKTHRPPTTSYSSPERPSVHGATSSRGGLSCSSG